MRSMGLVEEPYWLLVSMRLVGFSMVSGESDLRFWWDWTRLACLVVMRLVDEEDMSIDVVVGEWW